LTMQNSIAEFRSKDCKNNNHQNCAGSWNGFGFEVYCSCNCHYKKEEALESVGEPVANATYEVQSSFLGDTQR
jgi:hypothetical protein